MCIFSEKIFRQFILYIDDNNIIKFIIQICDLKLFKYKLLLNVTAQ